jgi:DNA-binding SARP family transcriptional activator
MTRIRLGLLGGFEITTGAGEPLAIPMRKAKALLAWLALHPGEPQSRGRLAGLLWAESAEAQARHSLRQALSVLRRALPDADALLRIEGETVTLASEALTTDVGQLRALAASADPEDLEQAAALYRGELLEGFSAGAPELEDWLLAERSALRELAASVLERLLAHHAGRGAGEPALRAATRLLALEPLREDVHRELMGLYVRLGRPAQALRQYRACQALLHRELGVAPEPATRELHRRILAERREAPAEPAPVAAAPAAPMVPLLPGREAELGQLAATLDACAEAAAGGVLLVRGEPGIGKTRLAGAAAELAAGRSWAVHEAAVPETGREGGEDPATALGRGLLDLPAGAGEGPVRAAVARACADPDAPVFLLDLLGVPLTPAEARFHRAIDPAALREGMRRAVAALLGCAARSRPRLLVVEDVHWADPGLSGLLAALAAEAAAVPALILLTTRGGGEPLDPAWRGATRGAPLTTLDLGPLRPAAALALARELGTSDPDWAARCVERAGGNPLFLIHLLRAGAEADGAVPDSVQGLIASRLDRVSAEDRRAAEAAAVLGQRFPAEALAPLAGGALGRRDWTALCAAGFLQPEGPGALRFTHALVREAVAGTLAAPARRALHLRAADWYRGRDPLRRAEHLEQAADPAAAAELLAAARSALDAHRYDEALDLAQRAARAAGAGAELAAEAALLTGVLRRELGEVTAARRVLGELVAARPSEPLLATARVELAAALLVQDAYEEALAELDAARPAAEALGDEVLLARLQGQRGNAFFPLGRLDECLAAHTAALEHARRAGDPAREARALGGLADAHYQRGRMVTAHHYYDRCVRLCERHGLVRVQAANLSGLAMCALYLNRLSDALADAEAAVRFSVLARSRRDECLARNLLASVACAAGDFERARREAEAGLAIAREVGLRRFEWDHLCLRGAARAALGETGAGLEDLTAAFEQARGRDMVYAGPLIVSFLLPHAPGDLRRTALAEAEAALAAGSLSHNHLHFRQAALEAALTDGDWEALEHHARALEDYTREEPLPFADFHVARARALMAWRRGERDPALVRRLSALAAEARQAGLLPALPALEAALAEAAGGDESS